MVEALAPFVYGHVGRYDDAFNPRAFGDLISRWGTPVILIETGALKGMSGHDLAGLNFIALSVALKALADGSVEQANPAVYDSLRFNEIGPIYDLLVRGGTVVGRAGEGAVRIPPYAADVAVNVERGRGDAARPARASVQEVGDLADFRGLEEVDARDYYVIDPRGELRTGTDATLLFYLKS